MAVSRERPWKEVVPNDELAEWVMEFVDHSAEEGRDDMDEIWDEAEDNFLVRPYNDIRSCRNTKNPMDQFPLRKKSGGFAILKDPETHQECVTIAAKVVLQLFPREAGFIRPKAVGFEDIFKAIQQGKLLEYAFRMPDHFWIFVEWILSTPIYGTGILEAAWNFEEEPRNERVIEVDPLTLEEFSRIETLEVPIYDDVQYSLLPIRDFFPDPGGIYMNRMKGAAKRFTVSAATADQRAEDGMYLRKATDRALDGVSKGDHRNDEDHPGDSEADLATKKESHPDFQDITGFEYYGWIPFSSKDGIRKRVITVLNGETVRNRPWARRIPFFDNKFVPRLGSFWGVGLAEVTRFDQDLADTFKSMMADAVVREVHAPIIYDNNGIDNLNLAKLKRFKLDVPIGHPGGPNAIGRVKADPPLQPMFSMFSGTKQSMREGYGATDTVQGLGLGTKRATATEFAGTRNEALTRPELYAEVLERSFLPELGKFTLSLYKEFLEEGTDDLAKRIGESNAYVPLANILEEHDLEYVGSQVRHTRQEKVAANREIFQMSSHPVLGQLIPWIPYIRNIFRELGQEDLAAMVGNPDMTKLHILLTQMSNPWQIGGGQGGGPQAPQDNPAGGVTPAEAGGQALLSG